MEGAPVSVADPRVAEAMVSAVGRVDQLIVPFEHLAVDESTGADVPFAPAYSRWLAPQGLNALGCLGWTAFQRGRLRTAQALCEEGLELAGSQGWMARPQTTLVTLVLSLVHFERGRYAEAERLLDAPCHADRDDLDPTSVAVHLARARVLVAVGRVSRARSVLDRLRASRWRPLPATVLQWLTLVEAELDLARGKSDAVSHRVRPRFGSGGANSDRVRVVTARAELAQGRLAEVETILTGVRGRSSNPVACAEAWLVTALAADRHRNDYEALRAMDHALDLAEPENLRRPFLAFGDRVEPMIRHRQRLTPDLRAFVTGLLADFDTTEQTASTDAPIDPLTDRERMVLRHMATLQTNQDIAADLCISVNTVKAHAKSVYRKLAIANRREAVERGRVLGLI